MAVATGMGKSTSAGAMHTWQLEFMEATAPPAALENEAYLRKMRLKA